MKRKKYRSVCVCVCVFIYMYCIHSLGRKFTRRSLNIVEAQKVIFQKLSIFSQYLRKNNNKNSEFYVTPIFGSINIFVRCNTKKNSC